MHAMHAFPRCLKERCFLPWHGKNTRVQEEIEKEQKTGVLHFEIVLRPVRMDKYYAGRIIIERLFALFYFARHGWMNH